MNPWLRAKVFLPVRLTKLSQSNKKFFVMFRDHLGMSVIRSVNVFPSGLDRR